MSFRLCAFVIIHTRLLIFSLRIRKSACPKVLTRLHRQQQQIKTKNEAENSHQFAYYKSSVRISQRGIERLRLYDAVKQSLEEHIAYLLEEIKHTEALIREHINTHPDLKEQSDLLDSIPGIGETTAALILAEIVNLKEYKSARQAAAYAGLVPRERRSGSSVRGRVCLSKIGNARLRKALYFPAMTALRCSDFFKSWAEPLRKRGKSKMTVIGAAMRKLIHLAYGVLKTGKQFDPNWTKTA